MPSKEITLEGNVEYRGPEDYLGGRKKVVVRLKCWDEEWSEAPGLYEQFEDPLESLGPYEDPVKIEVEVENPQKARISWNPSQPNAQEFNVRDYLSSE